MGERSFRLVEKVNLLLRGAQYNILYTYLSTAESNYGASGSTEEDWDKPCQDNATYHVLRLPRESVRVVDDPRMFHDFFTDGLAGVTIVGIDAEWKPSFGEPLYCRNMIIKERKINHVNI